MKYHQPTTKGHMPHQKDMPPCWFWLHPWKNVNKPINLTSIVTWLLIIHKPELGQSVIQCCPTLKDQKQFGGENTIERFGAAGLSEVIAARENEDKVWLIKDHEML